MAPTHFHNDYEDKTTKINNIFDKDSGEISEHLQHQINQYKNNKMELLSSQMNDQIFCDSSVYTGSAGIALYFFSCATRNGDVNYELMKTAWNYINLSKLNGRRISFLCGDAGPLALAAVISYKLGKRRPDALPEYNVLIQRLSALEELLPESPDELLYGKAGYLYALLFVNSNIGQQVIEVNLIQKVINSIVASGQKLAAEMKSESPLMWKWHDKVYFGAAHGMAGILYLLLQSYEYVDGSVLQNLVKPAVDWLLNQQYVSGNFPSSLRSHSTDRLVQWCHGAPGFVPLLLLCHKIFQSDSYLGMAIMCGDVIWRRGLCTKGYSICHGVAGNAYAFIDLYLATKDRVHLYRACCFAEWCVKERADKEQHKPDRPASLFEGVAGRLHYLDDLTNIVTAKFPAFTI